MRHVFSLLFIAVLGLQTVQAQTQPTPSSTPKPVQQSVKAPALKTLSWSCRVFYTPARSIWVREVALDYDREAPRAIRIDGVPVHGFSFEDALVSTHLDNERITLDLAKPEWRSTFRDQAAGQGACVKNVAQLSKKS
jgi:hypothetical protein